MKHEQDKDYLEFLTSQDEVPANLNGPMRKEVALSFHSKKILAKFFGFQFVGGLFSLYFCPQLGVGKDSALWHHYFMHFNEFACTVLCASFFLCFSVFFSAMALKGEEWWWLYRRKLIVTLLFPAIFFGLLMLSRVTLPTFNASSTENNLALWFGASALIQFAWIFGRAQVYRWSSSSLKI